MQKAPRRPLSGDSLMNTVRALADDIGPRPPGTPAEGQARDYVSKRLNEAGLGEPERIGFTTWRTWGWNVIPSVLVALMANVLGWVSVPVAWAASFLALTAILEIYLGLTSRQQFLQALYPKGESATLITRIPSSDVLKRRVVLIGHTDTNKARPSFGDRLKKLFVEAGTLLFVALFANYFGLLMIAVQIEMTGRVLQVASALVLIYALFTFVRDEFAEFVDGANDNASAVACTLGVGLQAKANPLKHTEIWLAFTGAEEIGLLGLRVLIDKYGEMLKDAYFIDFELVGAGDIAYVTHHSGFAYGMGYTPDSDSLRIAKKANENRPDLGVTGRRVVINEEVRALRQRGFKGICLVGLDKDGWLMNWHQASDNTSNINPASLETAASFAWEMLQVIEREAQD